MFETTNILDSSNGHYIMKLMIVQNIRISEETEKRIAEVSQAIGESKQTVIRLAIKEGLGIVERKLGTREARKADGEREP